ncbi:MAG: nitroreductase family protein [Paludibacter sp.]|nr:nitroreductase family protein [Paludibacter sp.]
MAIPTTRTKECAKITINIEKCCGCGKCVEVCKDFGLTLTNEKVKVSETPFFGCIACGHCMAVCPNNAITIHGRTLSPDDIFDLPPTENTANYQKLLALLQRRRSIREFTDKKVETEIVERILEAAKTAPMGYPPSDVNLLVFDTKEKNRKFAKDFCVYLKDTKWFVSKWFLTLMRPFLGKANYETFCKFIRPAIDAYIGGMEKGNNLINYDAPLAIYFYGSPYTDPADPIVAATTAMYAAESLGLGTCMLGAIHPFIQYGGKAKKFREKYKIKYPSKEGVFVIFGYPAVKYQKGLKRTFASVTIVNDE